ncbi:MAG: hypothetical protein CME68_07030 [Halobacteriovoraceae bacterium]|nr:hypothetical protein [Halobacteriovoraceae bacterium]
MRTFCAKEKQVRTLPIVYLSTLILIFLLPFKAYSSLTIGTLNPPLKKIQIDDEGNSSSFEFDPFVGIQHNFGTLPFWLSHPFVPEAGFVYHQVDVSEEYNKFSLYLLYEFSWNLMGNLNLLYGAGNFVTWITGSGGTMTRNNGSSTSTFYKPMGNSFSFNTSTNLGLEFQTTSSLSFLGKALLFDILSSKKRTIRYTVSLKYKI